MNDETNPSRENPEDDNCSCSFFLLEKKLYMRKKFGYYEKKNGYIYNTLIYNIVIDIIIIIISLL